MINRTFLLTAVAGLLLFTSCTEDSIDIEPGISKELAEFRKANIESVHNKLYFYIPESRNQPIEARLELSVAFYSNPTDLILDFTEDKSAIKSVTVDYKAVPYEIVNEHLVIADEHLNKKSTVIILFAAGELSLNRNDDYLYSLFVPARASSCFPVFDQPDLKATYELTLDVPDQWNAVSNGGELNTTIDNGRKLIDFEKTPPIPSYLFAFAVGKFDVITKRIRGEEMRIFHRETDSLKLNSIDSVFAWHEKALNWLEDYTAIDHPFPKMDLVLIPAFQYGGMEHPGAIFYKASSVLLETNATTREKMRRGQLISHEVAHMWFGNLVTMSWFDDVWLKEVFANFMAAKIVNPEFKEVDHDLQFILAHYPRAYEIDRSRGAHPILQRLDNLKDAGSIYGNIIYQKSPIAMKKLEKVLGEVAFQQGIRNYLNKYAFDNATWNDLIAILAEQTDVNLDYWDKQWVKTAGMPHIKNQRNTSEVLFYHESGDVESYWPQQLDIAQDTSYFKTITFDQPSELIMHDQEVPIFPNYGGLGYGYFELDSSSQKAYSRLITQVNNAVFRAAYWLNTYEATLRGDMAPNEFIKSVLGTLAVEKEALIVDYLTDKLTTVFWQLLTDEERTVLAPNMEGVLFSMALNAQSSDLRTSFFRTFYKTMFTTNAFNIVQGIWQGEVEFDSELLNEQDYIQMSYELAIRSNQAEVDSILAAQEIRISNKDRIARYKWVGQAFGSEKDKFIADLKMPKQRENEEWVLDALRWYNHPLRQTESVNQLETTLGLLEEVKATGDIFFPKRWLDAILQGHQSEEAADIVVNYLSRRKSLPGDLRLKVLQSADLLFRKTEVLQE